LIVLGDWPAAEASKEKIMQELLGEQTPGD
jgi:hypothetical protein